jgi:hypothetical protein
MQSVPMSEPILRDDKVISKVELVARHIETIAPWTGELLVGKTNQSHGYQGISSPRCRGCYTD